MLFYAFGDVDWSMEFFSLGHWKNFFLSMTWLTLLEQRDSMIASLQLSSVNSSVISSPFVMSPESVREVKLDQAIKSFNFFLYN